VMKAAQAFRRKRVRFALHECNCFSVGYLKVCSSA
jgi:hypothetical protein